ncbi:receptor-like protein 49 [Eucalyptus grandis]|uniref:receptor-like protein 49 n=1 Tax=Eucalyptus grandis TaxID=71139 RepID=UPI00192E88AD|nr:receptor-like protein 49 [Eucalyptus grandis]
MQCLSRSLQTVLFLFSFLIEGQAMRTMLSLPPSSLSLERAPCRPDQKSDLLHFRNALISDNSTSVFCQLDIGWLRKPKMLSWNVASDCCSWDGVICDPMTGHVTHLQLGCSPPNPTCYSSAGSSNSSKPSTLGLLNLPSPQEAERPSRSNKLLQNLTELRVLALDGLNLSGIDVNRLINLSPSLEVLSLSHCKLRGILTANIFVLPKLTCLNLSGNKVLSGYLPESTWNSSLKVLDLSSSGFSGVLPESIGDLHSLQILWLNRCSFTGSIPSSLGNLTWLTHLGLSYNEFSGQVPPTLSNLDQLSLLDLSSNNFIGPIPNVFDNKTQLLFLDFSHNLFTGPIPPSTKNLSNLARLDISNNLIGGFIPSSLFSLPSLMSLDLSNNGLSGHIGEFFAASPLEHVDLSGNQLRGSVPSSIFQLRNLTYLSISANNLTGVLDLQLLSRLESVTNLDLSDNILSLSNSENTEHVLPSLSSISISGCQITEIPAFLRNSTSIEWIDLSRNRIHSDIPSWVWDIGATSLSYLNLSHNFLTSFEQVPWKNLIILDLHSNLIQGPVPPPSFPHSIIVFSLASNRLTGFIPGSICEMKGLQVLDLSHNNFTGMIPQCLKNVSNSLLVLDMQENGLSGTISLTFTKDAALRSLHLNGNQFEGPLPRSLINCKQLEMLDLGGNKLNDTFPDWLETLPSLQVLVLRSNRLCGPISSPRTEFSFSRLRILDLSFNDFTGPLPSAFFANLKAMISNDQNGSERRYMDRGYYQDSMIATMRGQDMPIARILVILTTIDLSSNKFRGKIPDVMGELRLLKGLNLSHNSLEGHIPLPLGNLSELEWLDLSSNELSGMIPIELTNLTSLEVLNVSSNQLTGSIPQGRQFNTFQAESYRGNPGLCGFPLSKACTNYKALRKLPVHPEGRVHSFRADFLEPRVVEIGLGCGILLGLFMRILKNLISIRQANRYFRKIARKDSSPVGP